MQQREFLASRKISPTKELVLLWVSFTSVSPFMFAFAIPYHPYKLLLLATLIIMATLMLAKNKLKFGDKRIIQIVCIQSIFSPIYALVHIDLNYLNIVSHGVAFLLAYLFIINFIGMERTAVSLLPVFIIMGFMAMVAVLLGLFGILKPISFFNNPDGRLAQNYILTFSNVIFSYDRFDVMRPAGFFDEPGKFALYLTYMLVINKFLNWSKKAEWLIILSGIFTLSLAFFITLAVYIVLFYANKRNLIQFIAMVAILSSAGLYLNSQKNHSEIASALYRYSLWRLERSNDEYKIIKGDERTERILDAAKVFSENKFLMPMHLTPNIYEYFVARVRGRHE